MNFADMSIINDLFLFIEIHKSIRNGLCFIILFHSCAYVFTFYYFPRLKKNSFKTTVRRVPTYKN